MTETITNDPTKLDGDTPDRRRFLELGLSVGTLGALAAAYGTLATFMGRFLYPAGGKRTSWMYVTKAREIDAGSAIVFTTPTGASINVARQGALENSMIALSSTCPHLGCQVHWEAANDRFFCPCHNGIFDRSGKAIGGPPAEAGQTLPNYPLKVENGLVFIELDVDEVAAGPGTIELPDQFRQTCPIGPGHDPCLYPARLIPSRPSTDSKRS